MVPGLVCGVLYSSPIGVPGDTAGFSGSARDSARDPDRPLSFISVAVSYGRGGRKRLTKWEKGRLSWEFLFDFTGVVFGLPFLIGDLVVLSKDFFGRGRV